MSLRTVFTRNIRPMMRIPTRPAVVRQLPRRNYMVGFQPGVAEQQIAQEAATAVEMVFAYFGMMGVAFGIGSLGGAMIAEQENEMNREELRNEYEREMIARAAFA